MGPSHPVLNRSNHKSWFTKLEFAPSPHPLPHISGIGGGNDSGNDVGDDENHRRRRHHHLPLFVFFLLLAPNFLKEIAARSETCAGRPTFVHPPFPQVMQ